MQAVLASGLLFSKLFDRLLVVGPVLNHKIPIAEIAQKNPLRSNREQHNIATGITTTCHIFSEGALLFLDCLFSQDKKKSNFYNFQESLIQDIL